MYTKLILLSDCSAKYFVCLGIYTWIQRQHSNCYNIQVITEGSRVGSANLKRTLGAEFFRLWNLCCITHMGCVRAIQSTDSVMVSHDRFWRFTVHNSESASHHKRYWRHGICAWQCICAWQYVCMQLSWLASGVWLSFITCILAASTSYM